MLLMTLFLCLFFLKLVPTPDTYERYIETDEPQIGIVGEGNSYFDEGYGPLPRDELDGKIFDECQRPLLRWYSAYFII